MNGISYLLPQVFCESSGKSIVQYLMYVFNSRSAIYGFYEDKEDIDMKYPGPTFLTFLFEKKITIWIT